MRAGALSEMVEIQVATEEPDATGQPIQTWKRFAKEWAVVESVQQAEVYAADRTLGRKMRQFTLRHIEGITSRHRLLYKQEVYDIVAINEVEKRGRNHFIQLLGEAQQ